MPQEPFIAYTEVPGSDPLTVWYGWAGWTPSERLKAILAVDEELEDSGMSIADRAGLLDSAWHLLPDLASDDAAAATRFKAELQALVGPEGPSRELIEDWCQRFPPPSKGSANAQRGSTTRQDEVEEDDEL